MIQKTVLRFVSVSIVIFGTWRCAGVQHSEEINPEFYSAAEINISELHDHIAFLASDSLKGRKPGTKEGRIAAEYIEKEVANLGLIPMGDNGFQYFEVVTSIQTGENNKLSFHQFQGKVGEDFTPVSFSKDGILSAPAVFVGYGFDFDTDTLAWHDYNNVDVTGKWVMILRGDPEIDQPTSIFEQYSPLRYKVLKARDRKAGGVLFVSGKTFDENDDLMDLVYDQSLVDADMPVLHIKRSVADTLLEKNSHTIEEIESILNETRQPYSFETGEIVTAQTEVIRNWVMTQNVIAMLPGNDPMLKDEIIILGAHYDHLGFGGPGTGSRRPDTLAIHNGADDNASGVAAILEIIEKLVENRNNLRRSIFFMAFGAEEMGLLGSKYFAKNPLLEIENVKMMFNLDMVGRLDPETKSLTVGGTGTAIELEGLVMSVAEGRNLTVKTSPEGYGPSDHATFYAEDVPVLFFFTGVHEDYHTPDDDTETINFDGEKVVADYVYDLVVNITNRSEALVYQEAGPKERPAGRRRFKVTLGIMPDHTSSDVEGMRVEMVIKDRPAYFAGMQKGDIIIAMEGKPVKNIYDYMYRLAEFKTGQRISVEVMRVEEKVILIVDL